MFYNVLGLNVIFLFVVLDCQKRTKQYHNCIGKDTALCTNARYVHIIHCYRDWLGGRTTEKVRHQLVSIF